MKKHIYSEACKKIVSDENLSILEKCQAVYAIFSQLVEEMSSRVEVSFTTLFARCAYIGNSYNLSRDAKFYIQSYRKLNEKGIRKNDRLDDVLSSGEILVNYLEDVLLEEEVDFSFPEALASIYNREKFDVHKFVPFIRGLLTRHDKEKKELYILTETEPDLELTVLYDIADKNEIFTPVIEAAIDHIPLPFSINFLNVEFISERKCLAKAVVLDPDFLVDVTRIAATFIQRKIESRLTFLSKFIEVDTASHYILLGNLANSFFDALLSDPSLKFKEVFSSIFTHNPLVIAGYDDDQVKDLLEQSSTHFTNIKETVLKKFRELDIRPDSIYLEPTFYSMKYGLQGRLDLLHHDVSKRRYDIVELKSGKPFQPNVYGLSMNHYIQTLMYDLLVRSCFGFGLKPKNYVLYSKISNGLKYAPSIESQQFEAIKARNEIVLMEYIASKDSSYARKFLESFIPENYLHIKGFLADDIKRHKALLNKLKEYEKSYLYEFTSFILREHRLSKVGENGVFKDNGLASLWLESDEEKESRFTLLKALKIHDNNADTNFPTITFKRTESTSPLANFRIGDLVILYPYESDISSVLDNQVFKCTLIDVTQDYVTIKLRASQFNNSIFQKYAFWSLEADSLDSSYNAAFRSLYKFLKRPQHVRNLLLGLSVPRVLVDGVVDDVRYLTSSQNKIIEEMIAAEDYYLLWGPPGTGKTSMIIRRLAEYFYKDTEETILYIAYTNRAVDEICAALDKVNEVEYLRIGSTHGTHADYSGKLLQSQIDGFTTRKEITNLLKGHRIVVGTLSSILGKMELFRLIDIDRVVVDEASQILEPSIIGLLSQIPKMILIGDHKQLPAVVSQSAQSCVVKDKQLREIGIVDMSMSLFERLYHQCKRNGWNQAYGILRQQGRMHNHIMSFPNQEFYEGNLEPIPSIQRLSADPSDALCLYGCRTGYLATESENNVNWKTNYDEAIRITRLIDNIIQWRRRSGVGISYETIGVIAPYRAQIALIKKELEKLDMAILEKVTVDTVERFQGSARDIIIFSLCTNNVKQFDNLVSHSIEGVDRKLNVAITRAREQLFIVGNKEILDQNDLYAKLIASAQAIHVD